MGTFAPQNPVEQPQHQYHMKWETAYACPVTEQVCCSYINNDRIVSKNGVMDTLHTCALNQQQCPYKIGTYIYAGNSSLSSYVLPPTLSLSSPPPSFLRKQADRLSHRCDECGSPQRSCCFYVDPARQSTVVTNCVTLDQCPQWYAFNGSYLKNVGSTLVDDCNDCYLS